VGHKGPGLGAKGSCTGVWLHCHPSVLYRLAARFCAVHALRRSLSQRPLTLVESLRAPAVARMSCTAPRRTARHEKDWLAPASLTASPASQDASRLVDVCRQSIVFESPAGLAACLAAIAADRDVDVARVKNRLDPAHNAGPSAGFRSLALNLRVITAEARRLGIEAHVAEVQLLLREFAELKVRPIAGARPACERPAERGPRPAPCARAGRGMREGTRRSASAAAPSALWPAAQPSQAPSTRPSSSQPCSSCARIFCPAGTASLGNQE
jgi:hypothetical protein